MHRGATPPNHVCSEISVTHKQSGTSTANRSPRQPTTAPEYLVLSITTSGSVTRSRPCAEGPEPSCGNPNPSSSSRWHSPLCSRRSSRCAPRRRSILCLARQRLAAAFPPTARHLQRRSGRCARRWRSSCAPPGDPTENLDLQREGKLDLALVQGEYAYEALARRGDPPTLTVVAPVDASPGLFVVPASSHRISRGPAGTGRGDRHAKLGADRDGVDRAARIRDRS